MAQIIPACCRIFIIKFRISVPAVDVSHGGIVILGIEDESCFTPFLPRTASCEPTVCHSIVGLIAGTDKSLLAWVLISVFVK